MYAYIDRRPLSSSSSAFIFFCLFEISIIFFWFFSICLFVQLARLFSTDLGDTHEAEETFSLGCQKKEGKNKNCVVTTHQSSRPFSFIVSRTHFPRRKTDSNRWFLSNSLFFFYPRGTKRMTNIRVSSHNFRYSRLGEGEGKRTKRREVMFTTLCCCVVHGEKKWKGTNIWQMGNSARSGSQTNKPSDPEKMLPCCSYGSCLYTNVGPDAHISPLELYTFLHLCRYSRTGTMFFRAGAHM